MNQIVASGAGQKEAQLAKIRAKRREQEARLAQQESIQSTQMANAQDSTDWTTTYKKWDLWEDKEEIKQSITAEKEREDNMMKSHRSMIGCGSADRSAERRVAELGFNERVVEMETFKNQGNHYFEEGQYGRAVQKYKRILIFYEYAFPDTKYEEKIIDDLRLIALMNSAACYLKLRDLEEALESCRQALKMSPNNVKVLYRRALLYRLRDDYDLARVDVDRAIRLDPDNKHLIRERMLLCSKVKAYRASRKAMGDKMFERTEQTKVKEPAKKSRPNGDESEKSKFHNVTSAIDSMIAQSVGNHKVSLDDLFVPISVDVEAAEKIAMSLSGINLMDGTTLKNMKNLEEVDKANAGGRGLSWAFRHPVSCECQAPEIVFEDDDVVDDGGGYGSTTEEEEEEVVTDATGKDDNDTGDGAVPLTVVNADKIDGGNDDAPEVLEKIDIVVDSIVEKEKKCVTRGGKMLDGIGIEFTNTADEQAEKMLASAYGVELSRPSLKERQQTEFEKRSYDDDADNVFDILDNVVEDVNTPQVRQAPKPTQMPQKSTQMTPHELIPTLTTTTTQDIPEGRKRTFFMATILLIVLTYKIKPPLPVLFVIGCAFGHYVETVVFAHKKKETKTE